MSFPKVLPGRFTVQDYLGWDDNEGRREVFDGVVRGGRYELIHGTAYDRGGGEPTLHQETVLRLLRVLHPLPFKDQGLELLLGPLDVVLSADSVVQPEITVCPTSVITKERIVGNPFLVIEVVAPLTALYDRREKQQLYEEAGIQEYLCLDPYERFAEVFTLHEGKFHSALLGEEDPLDLMGYRVYDRLGEVFGKSIESLNNFG